MPRILPLLLLTLLTGCNPAPPTPEQFHGTWLDPAMEMPDLTVLASATPLDEHVFADKYVLLAFGYTYCPDVCPTTMSRLKRTVSLLGDDANKVQVILISVDPDRDTPEKLASYAASFHPSFIGLGGSLEQIRSITGPLGIYHARADSSDQVATDGGYIVDHTAYILAREPGGGIRLIWSFEKTPEEMAEDLALVVG